MEIWDKQKSASIKKKLDTITVWELMNNRFYIPDYQRGYRWTSKEVKKLLEDLSDYFTEYKSNSLEANTFYCMQPLVVFYNKEKQAFEVIDGQQRLTTLYLILSIKKERLLDDNPGMSLYELSYQSRPGSEEFLKNIDFSKKNLNIDYYNICNAVDTITNFYNEINVGKFVDNVLNAKDEKDNPSVRFIWYDVTDEIENKKLSSEKIFSRLNIGKINLTNAELIKALFLNRIDGEIKKLDSSINNEIKNKVAESLKNRIAKDWDEIEHSLQDDEFWSFIYGKDDHNYDTRIEYLFDLIKNKNDSKKTDSYYTFDCYVEDFKAYDRDIKENKKNDNTVEKKWEELTNRYYLYKDWYENNDLYHLIGYLRYKNVSIDEITALQNDKDTENYDDFLKKLRKWCVCLAVGIDGTDITNLKDELVEILKDFNYNESSKKNKLIYSTLLLFNVLTSLDCKKSNVRFSFKNFYNFSWDLEHVRSQTPKDAQGNDRTDWILTNLQYFSGEAFPFEKKIDDSYRKKLVQEFKKSVKNTLEKTEDEIVIKADDKNPAVSAKYICNELLSLLDNDTDITTTAIYKILSERFIDENNSPLKEVDNIHNLVLLDSGTNRSYKNAFFPVKRRWINEREKNGIYILPCTKNVFAKSYSAKLFDLMNWSDADADAYFEELVKCLSKI